MARAPIRISFYGQLFSSINQAAKIKKIFVRQIQKKLKDKDEKTCFELSGLSTEEASLLFPLNKRRGKDKTSSPRGEKLMVILFMGMEKHASGILKNMPLGNKVFYKNITLLVLSRAKLQIYTVTIWKVGGLWRVVTTLKMGFQ